MSVEDGGRDPGPITERFPVPAERARSALAAAEAALAEVDRLCPAVLPEWRTSAALEAALAVVAPHPGSSGGWHGRESRMEAALIKAGLIGPR